MIPKAREETHPGKKLMEKVARHRSTAFFRFLAFTCQTSLHEVFYGKSRQYRWNKEKNHCVAVSRRTDFYCHRSRFGLEKHTRSTTRLVSFRQEQMCPEIVIAA
ncbi:hypothetical protein CEXT_531151 [Caerostris extrusa]|uniref:Uncharacterized protein n=1 Tax=Caerostris extrusa TaxID=172846 RepID=A0AAV4XGM8_CAEEX|nr:hypothetical protein CEXT_531151 [Caerostris extrusa]